jgi:uncharacterized protein (TIGR00266 family)
MEFCIKHAPVFSVLEIKMSEAEVVIAQPNSMLSMTSGLQLTASVGRRGSKSSSGLFGGMKSVLGGESVFTAEFRAKRDGQLLMLAPDAQGDILTIPLSGHGGIYLTRGAYLANIGDCELTIKYGGVKGMMAKTGLFLLHAIGEGTVFCQSYGAIVEKDLTEGENFFVDNRYMVAFADTVQYQLVKATSSVKDSILSGEGLVVKYTGPGRVYYQTRGKPAAGWLSTLLGAAF